VGSEQYDSGTAPPGTAHPLTLHRSARHCSTVWSASGGAELHSELYLHVPSGLRRSVECFSLWLKPHLFEPRPERIHKQLNLKLGRSGASISWVNLCHLYMLPIPLIHSCHELT